MVYFLFILLFSLTLSCKVDELPADTFLIDTIQAVVFASEGTEIITMSDVERPNLSGSPHTCDDIIFERLVFLDAKKHRIMPDEDALDAYLAAIQREHNLSPDELDDIFISAGYTGRDEGRKQLQIMQTIDAMLGFKIRSNLIVPRREVEKYYNVHPEIVEALYVLERAFIPFSSTKSKEQQRKELVCFAAQTGKGINGVQWSDHFTIQHSDIAAGKSFIFSMQVGNISQPEEIDGGFELFRLKEKNEERLLTLDERYRDIADILRRPRYEELVEEYKKKLFEGASVVEFG